MPGLGSPDFGANPNTNPTAPSFDTGEDTTRLLMGGGSNARSGRWLFATGFEEGSTPYIVKSASGTGGKTELTAVSTFQGAAAYSIVAGNAINNFAYIRKTFMYPSSSYGLELMFARPYALTSNLEISIGGGGKGVNKDKYRIGKIVFAVDTGAATVKMYHDINGSTTLLMDVTNYLTPSSDFWHYFKMVFNFDTNRITLIKFDDVIIQTDLAGYEYSASFPNVQTEVYLINKFAGVNPNYYIDNLIITADEP